ncbi:hypothetical protein ACFQLX_03930 [Streptomyces polyrhachis]|uniref:Secreted protein n=1 Tax=Streptomyces polyrhachis TaxID=1282885 RepID=A0ABW2GCM9_9ACTN
MKTRRILGATLLGAAFAAVSAGAANAADTPVALPKIDVTGLGTTISLPDALLSETDGLTDVAGLDEGTLTEVTEHPVHTVADLGDATLEDVAYADPSMTVDGLYENLGGLTR